MKPTNTTRVSEGRYPSKQSPKMKALADKAEADATEERSKPKKKVMKTVKEHKAISGLAFLVESELDKSSAILAVKGITEKLQKMAKDLADMEGNDILPILDSMRLTFGPELTDHFRESTVAKIRETMDSVMNANETITTEIGRLETHVNGGMTNDMASGEDDLTGGDPLGGGDVGDDIEMGAEDDGMGGEAPDMEMGAEEGDGGPPAEAGGDDLDAAFDAAAGDTTAAGRARKESIERNVKALSESRDPDRLVFETFRRTLKESHDAVRSARAVATAFAIDFEDVVAIIKEGKTIKDEKGRSDNPFKKDRTEDRKTKKRERPSDLDEGKTIKDEKGRSENPFKKDRSEDRATKKRERPSDVDECEVTEGKTIKDEKGRSENPFAKDRSAARATKKRERPSDLDEASFGSAPDKAAPAAFGKKKEDPNAKVPSGFADMKKKATGGKLGEEFKMKPTAPSKKGMFDGKSKEELEAELAKLKKTGPHKKGSAEFTKQEELNFAIRAKSGWKKTDESKGFKTGGVAESARDAAATTRVSEAGDVFLKHQKAIALKTLRMTDAGASIMGGMTKAEARAVLKKCGYSDARIAKLDEDTIAVEEAVIDMFDKRMKANTKAAEERRAKGFGAMAQQKAKDEKKPVEEATGVKALIMKKRTEPKPFAKPFRAPKK